MKKFSLLNYMGIFLVLAIAVPQSRINANPVTPIETAPELENITPEKTESLPTENESLILPRETCDFKSKSSLVTPEPMTLGQLTVDGQTVLLQVSDSTVLTQETL